MIAGAYEMGPCGAFKEATNSVIFRKHELKIDSRFAKFYYMRT